MTFYYITLCNEVYTRYGPQTQLNVFCLSIFPSSSLLPSFLLFSFFLPPSLPPSLTYSLTDSLPPSLHPSPPSLTPSLTHSLTPSLPRSLPPSLAAPPPQVMDAQQAKLAFFKALTCQTILQRLVCHYMPLSHQVYIAMM